MSTADLSSLKSLLITADAFRIGGRETFLSTYLKEIKSHYGCNVSLLAPNITSNFAKEMFNEVARVESDSDKELYSWILVGESLINRVKPQFIWSHHYRLLPAWILSVLNNIPLLPTFHGPLDGVGAPGTWLEALGMTLIIHRMPLITAVSDEIAETLRHVSGLDLNVKIVPNRVHLVKNSQCKARHCPRFVMLSRKDKQGHLRAGVEFIGRWRRTIGKASLIIYTGERGDEAPCLSNRYLQLKYSAKILGRRWLSQPDRIVGVLNTHFEPPTMNPEEVIQQADVVIGMGRALLEGVAAGIPTVLIGYNEVIDLITADNFYDHRSVNFSGRNMRAKNIDVIISNTSRVIAEQYQLPDTIMQSIDVSRNIDQVYSILLEVSKHHKYSAESKYLAKLFVEAILKNGTKEQVVELGLNMLQNNERETFFRLVNNV